MKAQLIACGLLIACTPAEENLGDHAGPVVSSPVGAARWAVSLGTSYPDRAMDTAIDSLGDVVAVGDEEGPADQYGSPSDAGFVTKRVASDGSERWTVMMTPLQVDSYASAMGVAVDAQDNVIVIGSYIGSVDFGGQTLDLAEPSPPDRGDTFIAKYSWDGQLQWVRGLDAVANSESYDVAIDHAGRIVVVGAYSGALTLGDAHYADSGMYVATFDPAGTLVWGSAFAGPMSATPTVTTDANDDVWFGGGFSGPMSFGGAMLTPAVYNSGFVAHYRKDGLYLSSQTIGAGQWESYVGQIVASPAGQVVVQTSERDNTQDWGRAGIHVLDETGHEVWSANADDHGNISPQPRTLATTSSGLILTSAWDDPPSGDSGMEVVTYNLVGDHGTSSFGSRMTWTGRNTIARGCAVGSTGAVAYTGELSGTIDFGTGPVHSHATEDVDAFIVLLDPAAP